MSQATNVIASGSGAAVRTAINSALAAINTLHSGTTAPSYIAAGMLYWRTDVPGSGTWTLYAYDGASSVSLGTLNTSTHAWTPAGGSSLAAATQAEQEAGSSTSVAVTPGRQQYHPSAAKAWVFVTVSGGVPAATVSYNVSSITDSGTGDGIINFTTAFSSASYAYVGCGTHQGGVRWVAPFRNLDRTMSASAWPFYSINNSASPADADQFSVAFFGDQ